MIDEQREHLRDEYDEAVLKLLVKEDAAARGDALWKAYEQSLQSGDPPEIPPELDDACRKMIRESAKRQEKTLFLKRMGIGLKRVAVFALIFLCLASTLIVSVDALRIPVINFFVMNKDRYSSIVFKEEDVNRDGDVSLVEWVLSVPPPAGLEIERQENYLDGSFLLLFMNQNGALLQVKFFYTDSMVSYDSEDAEEYPMKLYNYDAIYVKKGGHRVFWFDALRKGMFDVKSENLCEEEFWKYVYRLAD